MERHKCCSTKQMFCQLSEVFCIECQVPENIKINTGNFQGKIRTIEALGAETVISIDYKQIELLALFQGIFKGNKGENINFDINANNILYFNDKNESIR